MASTDSHVIKERAIRTALSLGAGAVRVVPASADPQTRGRMQAAFGRGDLGTWDYDAEYARRASDPSELLHDARSVVCLALPYATPESKRRTPLRGRVSNYAWSSDYH
ncbi:MAG TPA: QueG-associated DUF1730 domain-containing protein, partial [Candidatus Cybelea sp.]